MRHPFDGIQVPAKSTRRSWIGGLFAGIVGLFAAGGAKGAAPPARRATVNPEPEPNPEPGPRPSTKRLGEEGGQKPATRAAGEAGGKVTTKRLGEEGGVLPPVQVTTLALGEEGGANPQASTFAVGEEG